MSAPPWERVEHIRRGLEATYGTLTSRYWCLLCDCGISTPNDHTTSHKHQTALLSSKADTLIPFEIVGKTVEAKHEYRFLIPTGLKRPSNSGTANTDLYKKSSAFLSKFDSDIGEITQNAPIQDLKEVEVKEMEEVISNQDTKTEDKKKPSNCGTQNCCWQENNISHANVLCYVPEFTPNFTTSLPKFEIPFESFLNWINEPGPIEVTLSVLLRTLMVEDSISESTVQKILQILIRIKENPKWLDKIPTLSKIKKVDKQILQIPVLCAIWKKGDPGSFKIIEKSEDKKNQKQSILESERLKICKIYFLHPSYFLAAICASSHCTTDWIYESISSSTYKFPNTCKQWNILENEIKVAHPNYIFAKNAEDTNATAIIVMIGLFIDGFEHLNKKKANGYYLSVFSLGEQLYSKEDFRFPITLDPINDIESWETISNFLLPFTNELRTEGIRMYFQPLKKFVQVFGAPLCCCGDDVGFRSLLGLKNPNCYHSSRFYNRNRDEFRDLITFNPGTDCFQKYRDGHKHSRNSYAKLYQIILQTHENEKYHPLLRQLCGKYGLSLKAIKEKGFPPFLSLFSNDSDFFSTIPPDELHIYRLGFLKQILVECNRKYNSPEYRQLINQLCPKVFIFKDEYAIRKKPTSKKALNPSLNGNHMVDLFTDKTYYATHKEVLKRMKVKCENAAEKQEEEFFTEVEAFRITLQHAQEWNDKLLNQLQEKILKLKRLFQEVFPKATCAQPNFENLDTIPYIISYLGCPRYWSTQLFEKLHKLCKWAVVKCNKTNIPKSSWFPIARKAAYHIAGYSFNSLIASSKQPSVKQPILKKTVQITPHVKDDPWKFSDSAKTIIKQFPFPTSVLVEDQNPASFNSSAPNDLKQFQADSVLQVPINQQEKLKQPSAKALKNLGKSWHSQKDAVLDKLPAGVHCESALQNPEIQVSQTPQVNQNQITLLLDWQDFRTIGCGLNNQSNTCFINSALQCLTFIPPLNNVLRSKEHSNSCQLQQFCMFCALESHVVQVSNCNSLGSIFTPKQIYDNLEKICNHFHLGDQEDSHEFLHCVLEHMKQNCLDQQTENITLQSIKQQTTLVDKIFGGILQSRIQCQDCKHNSDTFDSIMDLSLEVNNCSSLVQTLQQFCRVEDLDNLYHCESCKRLTNAKKQLCIFQPPAVLFLHLKRFSTRLEKISTFISYEEVLNITPDMKQPAKMSEQIRYRLCGVLVHEGPSVKYGHYFSFVYQPSGKWFKMNDELVVEVPLETVLNQEAYILFYVRVPPQMTKCSNFENRSSVLNAKLSTVPPKRGAYDKLKVKNPAKSLTYLWKGPQPDEVTIQDKQTAVEIVDLTLPQKRKLLQMQFNPSKRKNQLKAAALLQQCLTFEQAENSPTQEIIPAYENLWYDNATRCYNVRNDGNCFFRAVSFSLWKTEKYHLILRQLTYQEFIENEKWYENHWPPAHLKYLSNSLREIGEEKCWAGIHHFFVLCNALKIVGVLYGGQNPAASAQGICFPYRTIDISDYPNLKMGKVCAIAWYSDDHNHFVSVEKYSYDFIRPYLKQQFNVSLAPFALLCRNLKIPKNA